MIWIRIRTSDLQIRIQEAQKTFGTPAELGENLGNYWQYCDVRMQGNEPRHESMLQRMEITDKNGF